MNSAPSSLPRLLAGEGKDIELRHQRNPDVTFDCLASLPGKPPPLLWLWGCGWRSRAGSTHTRAGQLLLHSGPLAVAYPS